MKSRFVRYEVSKATLLGSVLSISSVLVGSVLVGSVSISGCSSSTDAPQSTIATDVALVEDPASPHDAVTASQTPPVKAASQVSETSPPPSAPRAAIADSASVDDAVPAVQVAPPAAAVAPPTAEQLARWTQPDNPRYELLACREPQIGWVTHAAVVPGSGKLLMAGHQITLWQWDGEQPEHVYVDAVESGDGQVIKSLAVSPDGKWFAVGDSEGLLRTWTIDDHQEIHSKQIYRTGISQIAISPNSDQLATTSYDGEISIWSADGLDLKQTFKVDTSGVGRIEYVSTNQIAVSGQTTSNWNVDSGALDQQLSPGRYRHVMTRSNDGKLFVFADADGLQFWDVDKSARSTKLMAEFATNELLALSTDAQHLVTANGFNVRLWDLATGRMTQVLDTFGWEIVGLGWIPGTDLFVVVSGNGCMRVWGTAAAGSAVGLEPLHAPIVLTDVSTQEPASPAQALAAIDLRTFPMLPDAKTNLMDRATVMYSAPVAIDEVLAFYRYQLGKQGWIETAATVPTPGSISFRKHGFMMMVSGYAAGGSDTTVSLSHVGNFDLRNTPRFDAAAVEPMFENENVLMYRTKADLLQIETTLLKKMHAAGWTSYARLKASHSEQEDGRTLLFLRGGVTMQISIGRFPTDPDSYTIQCGRSLAFNALPIPPDSGFVEFDDSTRPLLVATTSLSLQQTREFYETELKSQGWLVRQQGLDVQDEAIWMPFIQGQKNVFIGLVKMPNGRTMVRVGEELERSSWQLAKPATVDPATQANGIEAADFPVLNAAEPAFFDVDEKSIEITMDESSLLKAAEQYETELGSKGWKPESSGIREADYVFITFVKSKAEIALRAQMADGKAVVSFAGDGILWDKPLATGKSLISYEAWLRRNRHPAGLDLLDQYQQEMAAAKPADQG